MGGQTVTVGKARSAMGWVVMEVATGLACQARYELAITKPAIEKARETIRNHISLPKRV